MKDLSMIQAYKSQKDYPREAKSTHVFIDKAKNAVLIPFKNSRGNQELVPFHILTIKNASMNTENNISYLRINFHIPGQGVAKDI